MKIAIELGISFVDGQMVCRFLCNEPQNYTHPCDCAEYISDTSGAYCKHFIAYRSHQSCQCPAARAALSQKIDDSDIGEFIKRFIKINRGNGFYRGV